MNNDLISRSELINDLETYYKSYVEGIDSTTLFRQILLDIKNAPTVEDPNVNLVASVFVAIADQVNAIMEEMEADNDKTN